MASWFSDVILRKGGSTAAAMALQPVQPKVKNIDQWMVNGFGDMLELFTDQHPGGALSYGELVAAGRFAPLAGIRQIRINQMSEFFQPRTDEHQEGFRIRLRDRRKTMTRKAENRAYEIEQMIMQGAGKYGFGSFELDMRALLNDSLNWDQAVAQVLMTRGGKPCGLLPTDASVFRLSQPDRAAIKTGLWYPDKGTYVQIGRELMETRAEFNRDELLWGVRRPRTWEGIGKYGNPETEELKSVITSLANATTFNDTNFTNGVHANTIVALKSGMTSELWTAFMYQLKAMTSGIRNAKRTVPIKLAPQDSMEIHKLGGTALDMEFSKWINWLLKIVCALYAMDPAELGFVFGNEGQTSSMGGNANAQDRIAASKERGLKPLLRCVQGWLDWLVFRIDPDFCFEFVGLGALSPKERHDMRKDAVSHWMTPNEVRAQDDLPKLDHPLADLPLADQFRDAAMGAPGEGEGGTLGPDGEVAPFPGADALEGDDAEPFAKGAMAGVDWTDTDAWTTALVKSGADAMAEGRLGHVPLSRAVGGRTSHRMIRSHVPGVRAYVVEVAA